MTTTYYELHYEDGEVPPQRLKHARTTAEARSTAHAIRDLGHDVKLYRVAEVDLDGKS